MTVTGSTILRGARALATLLIAGLMMLSGPPRPVELAAAQPSEIPLSSSIFAPYQPIARYLSSASWLLVTGQDPRLINPSSSSDPGQAYAASLPGLTRTPSPLFSRN